jgi:hypothetical protein
MLKNWRAAYAPSQLGSLVLFASTVCIKGTRMGWKAYTISMLLVEFINQRCPFLGNMAVAQVFADNRSIFTFCQSIIIGVSGAWFSEFKTPYEKLKSLPNASCYLKTSTSFKQLDKIANKINVPISGEYGCSPGVCGQSRHFYFLPEHYHWCVGRVIGTRMGWKAYTISMLLMRSPSLR